MNNNYDFASKKTLLILLFICLIFFMIIMKAFDYIPSEEEGVEPQNIPNINRTISQAPDNNVKVQNTTSDTRTGTVQEQNAEPLDEPPLKAGAPAIENEAAQQNQEQLSDVQQSQPNPEEELRPIDDNEIPGEAIPNPEEQYAPKKAVSTTKSKLATASSLKEAGDYSAAVEIYKELAEQESNLQLKANYYEELANLFVLQKRYGSALIYAQKANNIVPTVSREALLKKLYEKVPAKSN